MNYEIQGKAIPKGSINEPCFYYDNQGIIRHENLVAVKEAEKTDFGTFYEFETLTLCPFFKSTIVKELLSKEEIN